MVNFHGPYTVDGGKIRSQNGFPGKAAALCCANPASPARNDTMAKVITLVESLCWVSWLWLTTIETKKFGTKSCKSQQRSLPRPGNQEIWHQKLQIAAKVFTKTWKPRNLAPKVANRSKGLYQDLETKKFGTKSCKSQQRSLPRPGNQEIWHQKLQIAARVFTKTWKSRNLAPKVANRSKGLYQDLETKKFGTKSCKSQQRSLPRPGNQEIWHQKLQIAAKVFTKTWKPRNLAPKVANRSKFTKTWKPRNLAPKVANRSKGLYQDLETKKFGTKSCKSQQRSLPRPGNQEIWHQKLQIAAKVFTKTWKSRNLAPKVANRSKGLYQDLETKKFGTKSCKSQQRSLPRPGNQEIWHQKLQIAAKVFTKTWKPRNLAPKVANRSKGLYQDLETKKFGTKSCKSQQRSLPRPGNQEIWHQKLQIAAKVFTKTWKSRNLAPKVANRSKGLYQDLETKKIGTKSCKSQQRSLPRPGNQEIWHQKLQIAARVFTKTWKPRNLAPKVANRSKGLYQDLETKKFGTKSCKSQQGSLPRKTWKSRNLAPKVANRSKGQTKT